MGLNDLDVCESGKGALLCFYRSTYVSRLEGQNMAFWVLLLFCIASCFMV